jgi:hypothetical protein
MNTWRIVFGVAALTGCSNDLGVISDGTGATAGLGSSAGAGSSSGPGSGAGNGGAASGTPGGAGGGSGSLAGSSSGSASGSSGGASGSTGGALGGGATGNPNCTPGIPTTSQIPRLTNAQYDRTVRDLLGITTLTEKNASAPSNLLATDQAGGLTDIGWAAYKTVADAIATQVMADPSLKAKFISCDPAVGKCLHDTVVSFGRRAFRRPLTSDETAAFDAVIAKGRDITPTGAAAEVAQTLLYLLLISPSFLQREELSQTSDGAGHFTLSSYEVASRLSFMLWGSTPDGALNQAADSGQLATPEQILKQAQRMVKDPKARDMVSAFHRSYALMGTNTRWDNTNKDATLYPSFKKELVSAMQQETELFFDSIVFAKNGTFEDLIQSPLAFVSSATAPLYGLDASKFTQNLSETSLDGRRPGFLTRLGFLNAYSGYSGTSPILRGAFITKQVLGIPIGAPPPGAEQTPLPGATAELNTNRKRFDAMTSGAQCAGCHRPFVNPPGFVLEAFDTVGAWQTTERETGAVIDTSADIMVDPAGPPVHVTSPAELMAAIAKSSSAKIQYASRWVSFARERESHPDDACTVQQLGAKMTASGYTVQNLITDLTQTPSFRLRTADQ